MREQIKPLVFGLKLGMVIFPFFYILDYFIYPEYRAFLLMIRIGVSIYFAVTVFIINRVDQKYYYPILCITVFLISISISSMCLVTTDGFASAYYSGLLQIIIVTALLYNIRPRHYLIIMVLIVAQHFILLAQLTWKLEDLLINIFAVGGISILAIFVHQFIFHLVKENRSLKGLLPICANCKKIRDDKGYWNQIESYIQTHSEAEFTHGICPECSERLYGDQDWYINFKKKKNS
jgi:hypothetical protein